MSKLKFTINSATDSIKLNKSRSLLTILGIVIGVAAIIIIMSIGRGASDLILGEVQQMGAETVVVLPGDMTDPSVIFSDSLTVRDVAALQRRTNVPNLVDLMPIVVVSGSVSYRSEIYQPTMIIGGKAQFFGDTFNVYPAQGSIFTDADVDSRSRVAVIGHRAKDELFGESDAVGERISIRNNQFRIVGVYPKTGQRGAFDIDDLIVIPYTTAQTYLLGSNHFHRIMTRADDASNANRMARDIEATLRETHGLHASQENDFSVITQEGLITQISTVITTLTVFLSSVVAIALVVGGIGVMNIMLVSVTERTREIGLRKALGATRHAILSQFLWEAVILTVVGGIIGIILGGAVSFAASLVLKNIVMLNWNFIFPIEAAILGVFVSVLVGLVFGIYPAKRAAAKDPIDALKYE